MLGNVRIEKNRKPLSYHFYFVTVVLIAILGFFDSIYLSISHYRVYSDAGYESFCAITRSINCDTVSQSSYSIFLNVPVPIWGVIGYGAFLSLLSFAYLKQGQKGRVWTVLMLISLVFGLYSIALAFISAYYIHSYCIMCVLSYAVNLLLLYFTWMIKRRYVTESTFTALKRDGCYLLSFPKRTAAMCFIFGITVICLWAGLPKYWEMGKQTLDGNLPHGINEEGDPWIGSENPELEISEFSDYQCFQCRKMHFFLRQLISKNPEKIRLVHRHFPMDREYNPLVAEDFHNGSGKMSIIALYAMAKGCFWEVNDFLFDLAAQKKDVTSKTIADGTPLSNAEIVWALNKKSFRLKLKHDIAVGLSKGIKATPGFIINGKVYIGQIPPDILKKYIR